MGAARRFAPLPPTGPANLPRAPRQARSPANVVGAGRRFTASRPPLVRAPPASAELAARRPAGRPSRSVDSTVTLRGARHSPAALELVRAILTLPRGRPADCSRSRA